MKPFHWSDLARACSTVLLMPLAAWAQTPSAAAPTPESTGARLMAFLVPLVLLVAIIAAVKIYDLKKKRDEESMSLEARISDALLIDPMLKGIPLVATVHMPFSRRSETVVELTGSVPSSGLREAANQIAARECSIHGVDARIEDLLVVDPLALQRVA